MHIDIIVVLLPSSVDTWLGIHVEYTLFLCDFNDIWIFSMLIKVIKFNENPTCGSRVDNLQADTQTDRRTGVTKRVVGALCDFVKLN